MSETRYTEDHEWIRIDDAGEAWVGITDYAQDQLGELVFVDLPTVEDELDAGAELAVVESVKAAGEVKAPVDCVVHAINDALADEPGKINEDPFGEGWIAQVKLADETQFHALMDEAAYAEYIETL